MKKKGIIISIVGILLVVAIGIFCLPVLQVKHLLKEVSDYERFQYELSIELDKAQLSQKETQLLETIAKLLGITEEDIFCWTAKGSVYDNTIYAKLYCRGFEHAVTELYLTEETSDAGHLQGAVHYVERLGRSHQCDLETYHRSYI